MRTLSVTSVLSVFDDLAAPLPAHISVPAVERLASGTKEFLIQADAIDEEFDESGALAGRFRIELPDIAAETLVLAIHIIIHAKDPNHFIETVPAIVDWLNKIRAHIDVLDRRSGELCVYKAFLMGTGDSNDGGLTSQALCDRLPCRLRIIDEPKCRFHKTWGCKITISDLANPLKQLKERGAISEGIDGQWTLT